MAVPKMHIEPSSTCLVIGAGKMGVEHLKVLHALIPGRIAAFAPSKTHRSEAEKAGAVFYHGSLELALESYKPTHVIIAGPIHLLAELTLTVLQFGVRNLLVEKPAILDSEMGNSVLQSMVTSKARIWVGYNRRFYTSVQNAKEMIAASGDPITSVLFEFTELPEVIKAAQQHNSLTKSRWVLANSMHVIDAALHVVGLPDIARSLFIMHGALEWHPSASVFAGAGVTEHGIPFSYCANWDAPGRWGFEWMTRSMRYIFRPLEKLQVMRCGTMAVENMPLDDEIDQLFKPGIYRQNEHFLAGDPHKVLVSLEQALNLIRIGMAMGGYQEMKI